MRRRWACWSARCWFGRSRPDEPADPGPGGRRADHAHLPRDRAGGNTQADRAPQSLDEDVVQASALAVHRQLQAGCEQRLGKLGAGKLATLGGVEDLGRAVPGHPPLHGFPLTAANSVRMVSV